ncbi:MAG: T9SS type A sorting domain-containing protein [Cytophagia bacterium]|nr:T9SS type A sorting domain-containing protein [Cytophagia bacterium]
MRSVFTLLIGILIISTTQTLAQNVSLYAGTPNVAGHNAVGTTRLNAKFNNPVGVAFDKDGYMWVSEWSNHTIRVIAPSGMVYTKAGAVGQDCFDIAAATSSKFSNPAGICFGPDDTLYVADFGNHCVRRIDPMQASIGKALWCGVKAGKYSAPGPGNPNCFTSYPGHRDGTWQTAKFKNPSDVDCDAAGNIYVADQGNNCIRKIGINGMVTTIAGIPDSAGYADGNALGQALFNWPTGIYVHTNGDIYVAEWQSQALRKISGGKVSTVLIYPTLWTPSDVYIDSRGIVYVSDQHKIVRWDGNKSSVFAGSPQINVAGYVNDTATAARFDDTRQMVVDPSDYHFVYVADFNNHVIRKITICDDYKPKVTFDVSGTVFCKGDQRTLTAEDGYTEYKWSTGETTKSIVVTSTKTVWLEVLNTDLCRGYSDTFNFVVNNLKPSITPTATSFCIGDSAFIVGQSGFDYYTWYKNGVIIIEGVNEQTLTVYDSGDYYLKVISGPCVGSSAHIAISLGQLTPVLNHSGNKVICIGDSLIVEPVSNFNTYEWRKDGNLISTSKQIIVKDAGTYALFAANAAGCNGTSLNLVISNYPKPPKPSISTSGDSILVSSSLTGNQWYRNDTLLVGSNSQGYYATIPGWYKIEVSNQYGCKSTSEPFPFGGVGMKEGSRDNQLILYPNPTNGQINISIKSERNGLANVQISNMLGEIVYESQMDIRYNQQQKEIQLNHLDKGLYFLIFKMDGISEVHKIILN